MKKKVIMAVFLIGILLIVGFSVYGLNKFFNSPQMLTKKYSEELGDVISLEENQKVIRVIKEYVDGDEVEDYVVLYGKEKYSDVCFDSCFIRFLSSYIALSARLKIRSNVISAEERSA